MIGKAKACKGGSTLANYVMKPEKGYELLRFGLCGEKPTEIMREMRVIQNANQRAKNKFFSLVLSPHKEEGKTISDKRLQEMTKDFMKELEINPERQQFIAFVHTEVAHKHIHIIANRVQREGTLISDHHIGKRAQWAANRIAKKNNLISAKEKQIKNLKSKRVEEKRHKAVRQKIKRKHDWVMSKDPKSMQIYFKMMNKVGVEVKPTINKFNGKVQGMRVKDLETGLDFKASEVHRSMSLNKIMKTGIPYEASAVTELVEDAKTTIPEFELSVQQFLSDLAWAMGGQEEITETDEQLKRKRKKHLNKSRQRKI